MPQNKSTDDQNDSLTQSIAGGIKSAKSAASKTAVAAKDMLKDSVVNKLVEIKGIKPVLSKSGFIISFRDAI